MICAVVWAKKYCQLSLYILLTSFAYSGGANKGRCFFTDKTTVIQHSIADTGQCYKPFEIKCSCTSPLAKKKMSSTPQHEDSNVETTGKDEEVETTQTVPNVEAADSNDQGIKKADKVPDDETANKKDRKVETTDSVPDVDTADKQNQKVETTDSVPGVDTADKQNQKVETTDTIPDVEAADEEDKKVETAGKDPDVGTSDIDQGEKSADESSDVKKADLDPDTETAGKDPSFSEDTVPETPDFDDRETEQIDDNSEGSGDVNRESPSVETRQILYTQEDFQTDDSDTDRNSDDMGGCTSRRHSDEDMDQSKSRGSSSDDLMDQSGDVEGGCHGEPEKKKWRQTTLNFEKRDKEKKGKQGRWNFTKRLSDRDTEAYRNGYPGKKDNPELTANLQFYKGEIESTPDGAFIDDVHKDWWGNYRLLERHHGYIQWIFPIRENGMNWDAQALQLHEAEAIKADQKAKKRVLMSYKMMLDFYGMELTDEKTGTLARSKNWEDRFDNLSWSTHNYLRITRILKSLGELGFEHLKKPFLQFVLKEAMEENTLRRTLMSCRDYWIGTLKNDADREELHRYIEDHTE